MIWSWLFPPRRQRAKPATDAAPAGRSTAIESSPDLPARTVRPVDGSPVAPLVVSDQAMPPADANAGAAAAAVGAALLFGADMAMHGRPLIDSGQPPAPDAGAAAPPGADAAAAPPIGNDVAGSAPPSDGSGQSSGDGQSGSGGPSGDGGAGSF